jgi:hypothetical protein
MKEIYVLVRVRVEESDPATPIDRETMEDAAIEAVANAVKQGELNGFNHQHADKLCISFDDAVPYEDYASDGGDDGNSGE